MTACRNLALLCLSLFLTACSTYHPLPIKKLKSPIEKITGYSDMETKFNYRRNAYQDIAVQYYSALYKYSDGAYGGGILALIGGVTKSVETAAVGGIIGAGSTIVPERYQLAKQAENYRALAKTYECLHREVVFVDNHVKYYLDEYSPFFKDLDRLIGQLNYKLIDRQLSVTLQDVSTEELLKTLQALKDKEGEDAPAPLAENILKNVKNKIEISNEQEIQLTALKKYHGELMIKTLKVCVAQF